MNGGDLSGNRRFSVGGEIARQSMADFSMQSAGVNGNRFVNFVPLGGGKNGRFLPITQQKDAMQQRRQPPSYLHVVPEVGG